MKYSVKLIIKHTVESGEVFLEQSIIMLDANSFDDAYLRAEQYVNDNEICCTYNNMYGMEVQSSLVSFADCFSVYEDEDVIEVYSNMIKCSDELHEDKLIALHTNLCEREDMLSLRHWPDTEQCQCCFVD